MAEVFRDKQKTWAVENREATVAYNKHVDEHSSLATAYEASETDPGHENT